MEAIIICVLGVTVALMIYIPFVYIIRALQLRRFRKYLKKYAEVLKEMDREVDEE